MRQRVVRTAVIAVSLALVVFALPLAIALRLAFFADEFGRLEREALTAAVQVGGQFAAGDPVEFVPSPGAQVGVYDPQLSRRGGTGPATALDSYTATALRGAASSGQAADELVVAVPVATNEAVKGVVRAASPVSVVWRRVAFAWLAEAMLATGALGVALLAARRQARTLSAPLEALATTAHQVTEGDLTARAGASSIVEIDRVGVAFNETVARLTTLLGRARHFSADASHQLRTPLTGLELRLEAALTGPDSDPRQALRDIRQQVVRLHETVDAVLRLSALESGDAPRWGMSEVGQVVADLEGRWHGPLAEQGRRFEVTLDPSVKLTEAPASLVSQILDVLLDNAARHGRGRVGLTVREIGTAVAIDVSDEGKLRLDPRTIFERGASGADGSGIGLALARDMAAAIGGRLVLASVAPTTFTLIFPGPEQQEMSNEQPTVARVDEGTERT